MRPGALQAPGRRSARFIAMSYGEFWARYLNAHADPRTRALHYLGTLGAAALVVLAMAGAEWRGRGAPPVVGPGPGRRRCPPLRRNTAASLSRPAGSPGV